MKLILSISVMMLALASTTGASQAGHTVFVTPYKGAPYGVRPPHAQKSAVTDCSKRERHSSHRRR